MCLVRGVIMRWDTIHGVLTPTLTAAAKHRAWESVKNEVNVAGGTVRSLDEVRNKFTDFKCHTKKKVAALNKDMTGTGGGTSTVPPLTPPEELLSQKLDPVVVRGMGTDLETELQQSPVMPVTTEEAVFYTDESLSNVISSGLMTASERSPAAGASGPCSPQPRTSQAPGDPVVQQALPTSLQSPQPGIPLARGQPPSGTRVPLASLTQPPTPEGHHHPAGSGPSGPVTQADPLQRTPSAASSPRGSMRRPRGARDPPAQTHMVEVQQSILTEVQSMSASLRGIQQTMASFCLLMEVAVNALTNAAGNT